MVDLTGGYGVDTFFMSEHAIEAHHIERNEELHRIVAHNFSTHRPYVTLHNTDADSYMQQMTSCDVIYIDPARRNNSGEKVFRIEDCEPNVLKLLPTIRSKSKHIFIKLSPMIDITAALRSLGGVWETHIVAVKNEVKEVLLISSTTKENRNSIEASIHAINIQPTGHTVEYQPQEFVFTQDEEKQAECALYSLSQPLSAESGSYIYEPNAAIIKAGAFKLIATRYGLCKMAQHTHLYLAPHHIEDFPGRVWQIIKTDIKECKDISASIMTRNYPLTPEQLRKKLKIKDNDMYAIIGARLADKPTLFLCKKI